MRWSNTPSSARCVAASTQAPWCVTRPCVHHHQLIGLQRQRDFVQHADHGLAAGHQLAHHQQPVGLVRRVEVGQRLVHQQHLRPRPPARAPAARAGARRPRAGPAAGRASPRPAWRAGRARRRHGRRRWAAPARPGAAGGRAWPRRRPSGRRPSFRSGPARTAAARARARAVLASGWPSKAHLAAVRQQPGQHLEQGRLARAVGADDAGPARARQGQRQCRAGPRHSEPCAQLRASIAMNSIAIVAGSQVTVRCLARSAGASATAGSCRPARRSARPPAAPAARPASAPGCRRPSAARRPSGWPAPSAGRAWS